MYRKTLKWQQQKIWLDDQLICELAGNSVAEWLLAGKEMLGLQYPKYFKMDIMSKAGILATEILLENIILTEEDKENTSLYICTSEGCIDADKMFQESMKQVASPAIFVYTLPNIVLGEISIKHKFKGEQLCYVAPNLDKDDMLFYIDDIFKHRGQSHCLAGYIDVDQVHINIELFWFTA